MILLLSFTTRTSIASRALQYRYCVPGTAVDSFRCNTLHGSAVSVTSCWKPVCRHKCDITRDDVVLYLARHLLAVSGTRARVNHGCGPIWPWGLGPCRKKKRAGLPLHSLCCSPPHSCVPGQVQPHTRTYMLLYSISALYEHGTVNITRTSQICYLVLVRDG